MTPQLAAAARVDAEQAEVAIADRILHALYGRDERKWTTSQVDAYLKAIAKAHTHRRRPMPETFPVRAHRSSAASRRRHAKQLAWRVRQIAPGAEVVRLTPVWCDAVGGPHVVYLVLALDASRQSIRLPRATDTELSGHTRIAALIRTAHPDGQWDRTQTWHAPTNQLSVYEPVVPAELGRAA